MNNSVVDNLEITRKRVSYLKNFQHNPHDADMNEVPQTIARAKDSSRLDSLIGTMGSIVQLSDLDLSDISYEKLVAFSDTDTSQGGTYQYSLQMRVQDGILGWLVDTLDRLTRIQSTLGQPVTLLELENIVKTIFTLNENINITQATLKLYFRNMLKHEGSLLIFKSYMTNLINNSELFFE